MSRPQKKGYLGLYINALRCDVEKDLEKYPEIISRLGRFKTRFIVWCANQRILFKANIHDEVREFEDKYIKSRLYNIDVRLWKQIVSEIFQRDNYTCVYCGQVGGQLEVDHIIPISHGGTNDMDNLATACRTCNRKKRDKSVDEFNASGDKA